MTNLFWMIGFCVEFLCDYVLIEII